MASRSTSFWTFILILIVLHLALRLALGLMVVPDLIVVAALLGGRRLDGWQSALYGLVLGILADSLALVGFGATSVAFVVVCYIGSRSRNFFEGDSYLFISIYAILGAWLVEVIRYFAGGASARGVDLGYLIGAGLLNALYVAAAAVVSLIAYRAITGHR
ncbi:MAG: rod shape-determining protein MreD [Gemmatimonadetes bacterium]|nr:rod shape-determining protein MreD [Gemmatimonadota bacterium]